MRVECQACGAGYDLKPAERERRARCKSCGAIMTIPAAASEEAPPPVAAPTEEPEAVERRPTLEERRKEKRAMPVAGYVVIGISFLLGLVYIPLTFVFSLFTAEVLATDGAPTELTEIGVFFTVLLGMIATCLVGGGFGLLFRKPWGWWASTLVYGFFFLLHLKFMTPLLSINWDHPRAGAAATEIGLRQGLPALFAVLVLVLLFLPKMRLTFGIKQEDRVRHRRAGSLRTGG